MRGRFHLIAFLIHNTLHGHGQVLSIRLHHLNLFPDRKLIPLLDPIQPFLIRFPDNAKVRIFLQIGVVVVNLSFL